MNIKEYPISTIDDITIFLKRREYDPDIKGYRAPLSLPRPVQRHLPSDHHAFQKLQRQTAHLRGKHSAEFHEVYPRASHHGHTAVS